MFCEASRDGPDSCKGEASVFSQYDRSVGTAEDEYRFVAIPDHMDMGGAMVRRIDHHAQRPKTQDGRQATVPHFAVGENGGASTPPRNPAPAIAENPLRRAAW